MSKPGAGRGGETPQSCPSGETNENKPKMNGELGHVGQSKIYSYMSPTKCQSARPPLQEENSTPHHEAKCVDRISPDVHKRVEAEKMRIVTAVQVGSKDSEHRQSDLRILENTSAQKQTAPMTQKKLLPADRKPESQRRAKVKSGRRKVQETKSPNRKVTDYFPVRRSCRKSKKELECEEKKRIDELITSGKEEGMKVDMIAGKGRGVIATQDFRRGEFVVEYHGDLIEITDAKMREEKYAQDSSTGCYMYYFQYLNKTFCVDATKETNRLGRLINHSKNGNCHTKLHDINSVPHLILIASRDIKAGEELLYDYGDRSRSSIEAYPWLKH